MPEVLNALLEDRLAIVGTSGSGKTYAAKTPVEKLIRAGARVCVVDPLGVWYGLRAGPDGAAAGGLPIIIFGGLRADVPIAEHDGARLAQIVAESDIRCIVDVSELGSGAARRRFMSGFAEGLYDANRAPLHLVLDEADLWAPQRPRPDQAALQGKIGEIVRRGRVRGFIPWLITQRPAVLDKDVLSQADTLIAMKLTSSQDRDAIGNWIEGQADRADSKKILADLPRLPVGEGYIWAPGRATLERLHFPAITTFDSSQTPKRGQRGAGPKSLATVDASALRELLGATPADTPAAAPTASALRDAEARGYQRGFLAGTTQGRADADEQRRRSAELLHAIEGAARHLVPHIADPDGGVPVIDLPPPAKADSIRVNHRRVASPVNVAIAADAGSKRRGRAELRILAVLAQRHPTRLTTAQWATLSCMSRKGGTWGTYVSRLRTAGYLDENGQTVGLSSAGVEAAGAQPAISLSAPHVRTMWAKAIGGAGRLIHILAMSPDGMARGDLANRAGMAPSGGTFGTYLSRLRTNGLIVTTGDNLISLEEELLGD